MHTAYFILYPRPTEDHGICQYTVESIVTLAPQTYSNISFWSPYQGSLTLGHSYRYSNDTSIDGNVINLDLTGNVVAKFIFPSGVTPVMYDRGNSTIGEEDGKGTLTYVYNSPLSMPTTQWRAFFDFNQYKIFFNNQIFNITLLMGVVLFIILAMKKYFNTTKKWIGGAVPSVVSIGWIINNYHDWYSLGRLKPSIILLMTIEGCLCVAIALLLVWCFRDIKNNSKDITNYIR